MEYNTLNCTLVEDVLKYMYSNLLYIHQRHRRCHVQNVADYSCELNDCRSESDEVHTLELVLLIFITL